MDYNELTRERGGENCSCSPSDNPRWGGEGGMMNDRTHFYHLHDVVVDVVALGLYL